MNHTEKLTKEIRDKLPRLMNLEYNQVLISKINDPSVGIMKNTLFIVGIDCKLLTSKIGIVEIGGYEYKVGKHFEIIGKDPMLNDVLLFLQDENSHEATIHIDSRGIIYQYNSKFDDYYPVSFRWDLSKPYMKDQSPELINFLHSLIKTKQ